MEFESPDVMKEFPGLFASESSKRGNDSDYSDETDKLSKKDLLLKRKEKKDKKDKEGRYAVLEGESSAEETEARSPSKTKKVKAFKFPSKSKEKREKSREKDIIEKKKEKKTDKKIEKEKTKTDKKDRKFKSMEECGDISDGLPIFGVSLDISIERSKCHDGIDIPLPVRNCIDYVEIMGLTMENVYKISGAKSKVLQIKKLYNQRDHVDLSEYDVPTCTSLLKTYIRDLPEPIFTSEMLVRFEEAGAILNIATREKHMKLLIHSLPKNNKNVLAWLLLHFNNVIQNEKVNKMNAPHIVTALSPSLHISHRLLTTLLHHCNVLFPNVVLFVYIPPLTSTQTLPHQLDELKIELNKQESLLSQIHSEMNAGYITKTREELLWEVQRITTQLKRKIKNFQKDKEFIVDDKLIKREETPADIKMETEYIPLHTPLIDQLEPEHEPIQVIEEISALPVCVAPTPSQYMEDFPQAIATDDHESESYQPNYDDSIILLKLKMKALIDLKEKLTQNIDVKKSEIIVLRKHLENEPPTLVNNCTNSNNLDEIMDLLQKENQILQIKKINLVRQIMEQEEICVDLKSKIELLTL